MDKYHIYEEIGKGEFSQVFKGREKKKIEYVAIKRVDKSMMNKIVNEVQIMHKLHSPHMLKFHDWYETRNNLWLILEYCTGADLESLLRQDGYLPEHSVRMLGLDIIEALKYLHQIGILHCDIRPRNFLIDEYGIVKISDFKLARKLPKAPLADSPIETRGAPSYMAPELFLPEGVHSYSSDFWSVGCVLYELRRGVPPFGRQVEMKELIERIRTAKPVENPIVAMEPQSNGTTKKDIDIDRIPRENNNQDNLNEDNKNIGIPRLSAELGDLLQSLLEKEPMHRCTWFDIIDHPFWGEKRPIAPKSLPAETAYDKLVRDREKNRNMRLEAEVLSEMGLSQSGIQHYQQTYYSDQNLQPIVNATPIKLPHQSDSAVKADRNDRQAADEIIRKRTDIRKIKEQHKNGNNSIDEYDDTFEVDASSGSVATRIATARGPVSPAVDNTELNENISKINQKNDSPSAVTNEISSPNSHPLFNVIDENIDQELSALQLIVHTSDTQVKPIVGNKAIEIIEKVSIKSGALSINMLALEEISGMATSELESHLSQVYKLLLKNSGLPSQQAGGSLIVNNSSAALTERAKILSYLNTIALSADVANIVLNTHFLSLLLRLLKSPSESGSTIQRARSAGGSNSGNGLSSTTRPGSGSSAPTLIANSVKTLLASALAVMLRYATFIQPPNVKTRDDHILPVLVSMLRDNNKIEIKCKRRIVAALGEMIFYITSQDDEETNSDAAQWVLPSAAIAVLLKCLKDDTDEIIRHYAAKTIENVMAQGGLEYRRRLCITEVAIRLLEISQHGRNDNLQATAGMALAHMFLLVMTHEPLPAKGSEKEVIPSRSKIVNNPALESNNGAGLGGARFIARVLEKGGLPAIIDTLRDGQPKLQQAYLNIINVIFCPINVIKIAQSTKKDTTVSPSKSNSKKSSNSSSPFNSTVALTASSILKPFQQFFLKTPAMVPTLLRLIEQGGSSAVRAKALITFQLLCSHRVTILTEHRLPSALMRMIEPYISNADMSTTSAANTSTYNIKCALSMVIFVRDTCIFALKDLQMQLSILSVYKTSEHQLVTPESSPQKSGRTPHTLVRQTPSSAKGRDAIVEETNKSITPPNIQSILQYSGIIRSAVSIASQPALGRLILASGQFCDALASVIKVLPSVREQMNNLHHEAESESYVNAIGQAEQACMFAVENVAQMDLLECISGIQLNNQIPDRIRALVSDPEIGLSFIISLINNLIPTIASLIPHPDGDIRVLVAASLRRLIPAALRTVIQTKYKDHAYNCISKYVPYITSQLNDQSPIPQYIIRLIADAVTVSPTITNEIMKDLKINGCVEVLIQLLKDGRGHSSDTHDEDRIQDPQLSVLLRYMFERPEMSMKMLQCDVAGAVACNVLNAIGITTSKSPISYDHQRAELLVPSVDLMLIILNYFIRSLAAIAESNKSPNNKSSDTSNLSEQLHRLATPLRTVCPALFIILAGPKGMNSKEDEDESMLAMLRDSASRCLGILFDIFPDSVTSHLLFTSEISLGSNSSSPNSSRVAAAYSINSNNPRIIISKIITQPSIDIRLRIRLLKILAGVVKMAPVLNAVAKVEDMFRSQPLRQALEICIEQDRQYKNSSENDDDRATIIRLAKQILSSIDNNNNNNNNNK